jgi:hypothetical protein
MPRYQKTTLVFYLVLGMSVLSIADAYAQKFEGGAFAGLTTSQVNGDGLGGFDIFGPQLGFFTRFKLSDRSSLQLEIAYKQKGAREPVSDTSNFYELRIHYVNLPLLFSYRISQQLSFEIGPALDIYVNSTESDIGGIRNPNQNPFFPVNLVGLSGIIYHLNEHWLVCFRSSFSITPIREGTAGYSPALVQIGGVGNRNITLSTALYYSF